MIERLRTWLRNRRMSSLGDRIVPRWEAPPEEAGFVERRKDWEQRDAFDRKLAVEARVEAIMRRRDLEQLHLRESHQKGQ